MNGCTSTRRHDGYVLTCDLEPHPPGSVHHDPTRNLLWVG